MFHAFILAAATGAESGFLQAFGGVWTCGNASYHERWEIRPHAGYDAPGAGMADVVYGDPQKPDGFAYVYFVPAERTFRYDDFHADGAQAHLASPAANAHGTWEWTGTYYPAGGAADPTPDITWTLTPAGTIVRTFGQRIHGKLVARGSDTCSKTP